MTGGLDQSPCGQFRCDATVARSHDAPMAQIAIIGGLRVLPDLVPGLAKRGRSGAVCAPPAVAATYSPASPWFTTRRGTADRRSGQRHKRSRIEQEDEALCNRDGPHP